MAEYKNLLKDKKIQLWKFTTSKVNGVTVKKWEKATPGKLWAYYRLQTGMVKVEGSALRYENTVENCIFVVNYRKDLVIDTSLKIVYNKKIYDITLVDDYEGYLTDRKISATLAELQDLSNYPGMTLD